VAPAFFRDHLIEESAMTFHFQLTRKVCQFFPVSTLLFCLAAGISGCASVSPATSGAGYVKQGVPSYVRNLPKSKTGNMSQYTVFGKRYKTMDSAANFTERGIASWYGKKFHGRKTSSGDLYDMYAMTAAHKHLPLPTYVRVTNLENNKSVIVLVNDRGPFVGERVIDLSFAAAMEIEMAEQGTAQVQIEALSTHFMDGEVGASSSNIAQAGQRPQPDAIAAPSVIEPVLAAVPLQRPIQVEAVTDFNIENELTANSTALAAAQVEPETPAAALPVNAEITDADMVPLQMELDTSEDGFVELTSLDSAPIIAQPDAVQAGVVEDLARESVPRVIAATDEQSGNAFIQLGAFSQQDNAQKMVDRVAAQVGLPAFVERDHNGSLFRVKMGPFKKGPLMEKTLVELQSVGIDSYTLLASKR